MIRLTSTCMLLAVMASLAVAQHDHERNQKVSFPNITGYLTLKCDFHMHTVFSDGSVWPDIRVQEALREGLDAIAITEHLEYQPHKEDIPHPDRNRAYNIALKNAENSDLIVIRGSEITRDMPPGHANAIFLNDANKLLLDDARATFEAAKKQDAFIFWNHPMWSAQRKDGIARLDDMHKQLIKDDLLHGIEVVNMNSYSDEALQIALDYNLTIMGTSDIHGLTDWEFNIPHGGHRSITLVFADERSKDGIKEALRERRTVVWSNNNFIGREQFLQPLLQESIVVKGAVYGEDTSILNVALENLTHSDIILKNQSTFTLHENIDVLTLPANETTTIRVKTLTKKQQVMLSFTVLNAVTAPEIHPSITLEINADKIALE